MNIEEGKEHLRGILVATHRAVAPSLPFELSIDIGPTDCRNHLGRSLGTVEHTLGYQLRLDRPDGADLLPAIEAHWLRQGYAVDRRRLQDFQPELLGSSDGFVFRALAVPGSGLVHIGGGTPCLPPVAKR